MCCAELALLAYSQPLDISYAHKFLRAYIIMDLLARLTEHGELQDQSASNDRSWIVF